MKNKGIITSFSGLNIIHEQIIVTGEYTDNKKYKVSDVNQILITPLEFWLKSHIIRKVEINLN